MSVDMAPPPHISTVNPNSPEFRAALGEAGKILAGTPFMAYSRHGHFPMNNGEVIFEEEVTPGHGVAHPMLEEEAAKKGLPSCWGVSRHGEIVVLRYADRNMHERSGIDVTSTTFRERLAEIGMAFAAAELDEVLEINIAGFLFPAGSGNVTSEVTNEQERHQLVTITPAPVAVRNGDWSEGACFGFGDDGDPFVVGICSGCPPPANS